MTDVPYPQLVPKLWSETIDAHRAEVRDAILDTAEALATEGGALSVTMSRIAEQTGIGRATLYKYFPDVESVFAAWHHRHIADHLRELRRAGDRAGTAFDRLTATLEAYAVTVHHRPRRDFTDALHRHGDVHEAQQELTALVRDLVQAAQDAGEARTDVPAAELAVYSLRALTAASDLASKAAVRRLVAVTADGLRAAR
jgi:AcrR family transcriptional regulator